MLIRTKLLLPLTVMLALLFSAVFFYWTPSYLHHEQQTLINQENAYLELLGDNLIPSLLTRDLAHVYATCKRVEQKNRQWNSLIVRDAQDKILFPLHRNESPPGKNYNMLRHEVTYRNRPLGTIEVYVDIKDLINRHSSVHQQLVIILFTIITVTMLASAIVLDRWIREPIMRLSRAAHDLSLGNFSITLPEPGPDEIGECISAFEFMRNKIHQRETELTDYSNIIDAIRQVQSKFITRMDSADVFNEILGNLVRMVHSECGIIYELQERRGKQILSPVSLICHRSESPPLTISELQNSCTVTDFDNLIGKVVTAQTVIVSNNPAAENLPTGLPDQCIATGNLMALPILAGNKLTGVAAFINREGSDFTLELYKRHETLFRSVGNLLLAYRSHLNLKRSEEHLRALYNNDAVGIITIDQKGIIQSYNRAAELILGYTREEMLGESMNKFVPHNHAIHHDTFVNNYLNGSKSNIIGIGREVQALRKDGTVFTIEIVVGEIDLGEHKLFSAIFRDITDRKQAEKAIQDYQHELQISNEKLKKLIITDPLTGIANRRQFDNVIDAELRRAKRSHAPLSLLMCDIDFFKQYNDTYGHVAGDACLQKIAAKLENRIRRAGELVARYGGEEFAIVLPGTGKEEAIKVAESIRESIFKMEIANEASEIGQRITMSIGVSTLTQTCGHNQQDHFVKTADEALYLAKEQGRNRVVFRRCQ